MVSKRSVSILIVGIVMFALGCLAGLVAHSMFSEPGTFEEMSTVSYSGVHISASVPDEITRAIPYKIPLLIEELEGTPRTITGLRVEGRTLTGALQPISTAPAFSQGTGNIAEGWVQNSYSLPLPARSTLTITIIAEAGRVGSAFGTITVIFDDGRESSIPIKFEISE
ncbi:MAG: hypothetical protein KDA29_10265 [Phycisphaerales bacterium]|nr:hypothetical protein [Phycisphaerales bacterium]